MYLQHTCQTEGRRRDRWHTVESDGRSSHPRVEVEVEVQAWHGEFTGTPAAERVVNQQWRPLQPRQLPLGLKTAIWMLPLPLPLLPLPIQPHLMLAASSSEARMRRHLIMQTECLGGYLGLTLSVSSPCRCVLGADESDPHA